MEKCQPFSTGALFWARKHCIATSLILVDKGLNFSSLRIMQRLSSQIRLIISNTIQNQMSNCNLGSGTLKPWQEGLMNK